MDLEKIATSAIVSEISKTDVLSGFINDGDKEPCWDGNIYIHEDSKHSKKNIKRIPTQVKGKAVKVKTIKDEISYPISYDDLNAYMIDGGTLFFVVYIDKYSGDTLQIYYSTLLPVRIKKIIKQQQKSYSVKFEKFPSDNTKKTEIVLDAYAHAQRQKSFAGRELPTIDELNQEGVLESISFHVTHIGSEVSPSMIPQIMEGKPLTIYANIKGNPIGIPVEHHQNIMQVMTCQDFKKVISVAGVKYFEQYRNVYSATYVKTIIGHCLVMSSPISAETGKVSVPTTFKFDIKGSLKEQIEGFKFVLAVADNNGFEIDDIHVPVSINENGFIEKITDFKNRLHGLQYIQDLLNRLHIAKDLEIQNCSTEDEKNLNLLIGALGEGKPVKNLPQNHNVVQILKVSNLNIGVAFVEHQDGLYYMHDFFNDHLETYWRNEEKEVRISQFSFMKVEDFIKYDNMYLPAILEDFKKIPLSVDTIKEANLVMLEMIKAFDECQNLKLLDCANQMNEWIKQQKDFIDWQISVINGFQIMVRQRKLTFSEKAELFSIIEKTEDLNYKAGAFILLGDIDEADKLFARFKEEQMNEFRKYPIYALYKKIKTENATN